MEKVLCRDCIYFREFDGICWCNCFGDVGGFTVSPLDSCLCGMMFDSCEDTETKVL